MRILIHTGQEFENLLPEIKDAVEEALPVLKRVSSQQDRGFAVHIWQKPDSFFIEIGVITNIRDDKPVTTAIVILSVQRKERQITYGIFNENPYWRPVSENLLTDMGLTLIRNHSYEAPASPYLPMTLKTKTVLNSGWLFVLDGDGRRVKPDTELSLLREDGSLFDNVPSALRKLFTL